MSNSRKVPPPCVARWSYHRSDAGFRVPGAFSVGARRHGALPFWGPPEPPPRNPGRGATSGAGDIWTMIPLLGQRRLPRPRIERDSLDPSEIEGLLEAAKPSADTIIRLG